MACSRRARGRGRGVAENREKRLFIKNTGACEAARRCIRTDACPVLEGKEEPAAPPVGAKGRIQAPVNGGGNYNHPKVAKFLVG